MIDREPGSALPALPAQRSTLYQLYHEQLPSIFRLPTASYSPFLNPGLFFSGMEERPSFQDLFNAALQDY